VKETTIRAAAILVGLVMFGVGIDTLFLADLGVGPWDVLHDAMAVLLLGSRGGFMGRGARVTLLRRCPRTWLGAPGELL
jgi:hypothetical protein